MAHKPTYMKYPVVAYRLRGEEEWRFGEALYGDLVSWLEVVVEGGTGRVISDAEGWFVEFHALPGDDADRARIIVTTQSPGRSKDIRDVELDIDIDRLRFAGRVYGALRAYAESDRYIAEHWAALSLAEDLVRRGFDGDPATLADCSSSVLKDTFTRFYPEYHARFPAAASSYDELVYFTAHPDAFLRFDPGARPRLRKPDAEFVIPEDFDAWTAGERRSHVQELLETFITPWGGADLRTLRSETLDAVLDLLRE